MIVSEGIVDAQTPAAILADLEHELRVLRDPVRLGTADGEHERHLRIPWRACRPNPNFMAGRTAHRSHRAANHRTPERSYLGPSGKASAILPHWRDLEFTRVAPDAQFFNIVDGRGTALGSGCLYQHQHGAIPRLRCGPSAGRAAHAWVRDAKPLYRTRRRDRIGTSICIDELVACRFSRRGASHHTGAGSIFLLRVSRRFLRG